MSIYEERCMKPYIALGDVSQCWLDADHEGTCEEANALARSMPRPCNGNCACGGAQPTAVAEATDETTEGRG